MKRYWKPIAAGWVLIVLTVFVISSFMPKVYRAKTTLLPVDTEERAIDILKSSIFKYPKTNSIRYLVNVLESRTLAERVFNSLNKIEKENLRNPRILRKSVKIISNEKKLIEVYAFAKSPIFAAKIANLYTKNLEEFIKEQLFSSETVQKEFVKKQLNRNSVVLFDAEVKFKDFKKKNKILLIPDSINPIINEFAKIKEKLIFKEIEFEFTAKYINKQHPEYKKLNTEIVVLKNKLKELEEKEIKILPEKELKFLRLERKVAVYAKVYRLLTEQYELAKIEESKQKKKFNILDKAIPPEKHFKPKRRANVLWASVIWFIIGFTYVLIKDEFKKSK